MVFSVESHKKYFAGFEQGLDLTVGRVMVQMIEHRKMYLAKYMRAGHTYSLGTVSAAHNTFMLLKVFHFNLF